MKKLLLLAIAGMVSFSGLCQQKKWTAQKANDWYQKQEWLVGANFLPSTAINQLEMWQAASFDTARHGCRYWHECNARVFT